MELKSITTGLTEIIKILKRYIHFKDQSSCLVLALFILLTYCFKNFDAVPYLLITGPYGSGKTLILDILTLLCYRALLASQISRAAFYHVIHRLSGTLLVDEVESLSRRVQHDFDMAVLLHGYKAGGFVVRVDAGKRKHIKFRCFGPKVIANIGGIYSKALKSRCIVIKTTKIEEIDNLELFQISRDGKLLKELASGIALIFRRKKTKDQIQSLYHNFKPIKGLGGRDLELWIGALVLAQIIDMESPSLDLFNRVKKIAIANAEKRDEDSFFLDWDTKFLIAAVNYFSTHPYDGSSYVQADQLTQYVIDEVKPPFPFRTEGLGKILDRESLLRKRRVRWFKDEKGNSIHRTGWIIDVDRLKNRVRKYHKYIQPDEECPDPQISSIAPIADMFEREYPNLGKN